MSLVGGWPDIESGPIWSTLTLLGPRFRVAGNAAIPTSLAWPTANTAILLPFALAGPSTVGSLFFQAGTTPGTANYDIGVYNEAFGLLGSLGATAAVSTTDAILPVGGGALAAPLTLPRGRYYLAMSAAATTITCRALAPGAGLYRPFGMQQMALAHPLPPTITPAAPTSNFIPMLGMLAPGTTIL
jgi:hypothetical protein